ncbi:uncharacterized protein LOC134060011 [Sardina pilchardus]|uniref:uncharacterized protein LOC134060011 n=1 Tax=Sardina pilchardus TaxID=27697 RepID=UPI002E1462D0
MSRLWSTTLQQLLLLLAISFIRASDKAAELGDRLTRAEARLNTDPCEQYTNISDPWRNRGFLSSTSQLQLKDDSNLPEGWYRFVGVGGDILDFDPFPNSSLKEERLGSCGHQSYSNLPDKIALCAPPDRKVGESVDVKICFKKFFVHKLKPTNSSQIYGTGHWRCTDSSCGEFAQCGELGACKCKPGYEMPKGLPTGDTYRCTASKTGWISANRTLLGGTPKVAFAAALGKAMAKSNDEKKIPFKNILTNVGGAYDNSTGVFTAPCDGVYYFSFSTFKAESPKTNACTSLFRNEERLLTACDHAVGGDTTDTAGNGAPLLLKKGDQVYITLHARSSVYDDDLNRSCFRGFLLFEM